MVNFLELEEPFIYGYVPRYISELVASEGSLCENITVAFILSKNTSICMCCNWQRKEEKSFQFMKMQWVNLISRCNIYSTVFMYENIWTGIKKIIHQTIWELFGKRFWKTTGMHKEITRKLLHIFATASQASAFTTF